jgi:hypothetical protein
MAEHRFHTPEPVELAVKIPTGDIDVETVDGDESFVSIDGDEKLVEATEVRQEGRRIIVELRSRARFFSISIGDFNFGSGEIRVKAHVPHGSDADLGTASADMSIRGHLRALEVKSASGDLVVYGDVDRDANVKTVSGDARLEHVGGELRVQTVSGDVSAQSVGSSITSKSVSGDLRVESAREGSITAQSVSGDIGIGIAPGTKLDVDAGSVSGDLTSEVPLGSEPDAAAGDGPMLVVRGKTVSGDFRVFRAQ